MSAFRRTVSHQRCRWPALVAAALCGSLLAACADSGDMPVAQAWAQGADLSITRYALPATAADGSPNAATATATATATGTATATATATAIATATATTAAVISAPSAGSTLTGRATTFSWKATGAQAYRLVVESPGQASPIYNAEITGTSVMVSGLPTNGVQVFATLQSHSASGWLAPQRYAYFAQNSGTDPSATAKPEISEEAAFTRANGLPPMLMWRHDPNFEPK